MNYYIAIETSEGLYFINDSHRRTKIIKLAKTFKSEFDAQAYIHLNKLNQRHIIISERALN